MKLIVIAYPEVREYLLVENFPRLTSIRARNFATVPSSGGGLIPGDGAKYFFASSHI